MSWKNYIRLRKGIDTAFSHRIKINIPNHNCITATDARHRPAPVSAGQYRSRHRTVRTAATADPHDPATDRNTQPASPPSAVTIPGANGIFRHRKRARRCGRQQAANPGAAGNPAHEAVRYRAARHRRQPRKPKPANPAPQELFPTPAAGNRSCLRAPFPYYRRHPSEGASLPREKGRKPFQNTPKPVSGIARQNFTHTIHSGTTQ